MDLPLQKRPLELMQKLEELLPGHPLIDALREAASITTTSMAFDLAGRYKHALVPTETSEGERRPPIYFCDPVAPSSTFSLNGKEAYVLRQDEVAYKCSAHAPAIGEMTTRTAGVEYYAEFVRRTTMGKLTKEEENDIAHYTYVYVLPSYSTTVSNYSEHRHHAQKAAIQFISWVREETELILEPGTHLGEALLSYVLENWAGTNNRMYDSCEFNHNIQTVRYAAALREMIEQRLVFVKAGDDTVEVRNFESFDASFEEFMDQFGDTDTGPTLQ
jgi:hypothetical protein